MCEAKLQDVEVNVDIIRNKLCSLNEDKAAGDDNLLPHILKAIASEIALPVTMIFRKSLDTGCVRTPKRLENSKRLALSPIFKKVVGTR